VHRQNAVRWLIDACISLKCEFTTNRKTKTSKENGEFETGPTEHLVFAPDGSADDGSDTRILYFCPST
jgi:hypothetical protein